jgi:hypothetical protein
MVAEIETLIEESEEFIPTEADHLVVPDPKDEAGMSEAILHIEQD